MTLLEVLLKHRQHRPAISIETHRTTGALTLEVCIHVGNGRCVSHFDPEVEEGRLAWEIDQSIQLTINQIAAVRAGPTH